MRYGFQLCQVMKNIRSGDDVPTPFGSYTTLAEAKKAAKAELKGARWIILEQNIVARSEG